MHRLRHPALWLLLALWLPATNWCRMEQACLIEQQDCCAEVPAQAESGCCYLAALDATPAKLFTKFFAPTQKQLVSSWSIACPPALVSAPQDHAVLSTAPPEFLPLLPFDQRLSLPPRAPDALS